MKLKKAPKEIREYQCSGCIKGCGDNCYKKCKENLSCEKHYAGTFATRIGNFYLGMPKGFNRIGKCKEMILNIYKSYEEKDKSWKYDKFNVPTWKYCNGIGHVFVRGISPRINAPFIHVILKCSEKEFDKINCLKITKEDMDGMN